MNEDIRIKDRSDEVARRIWIYDVDDPDSSPTVRVERCLGLNSGKAYKTDIALDLDFPEFEASRWREIVPLIEAGIELAEEWDKEAV